MTTSITRRSFIAGTAGAALSLAACGGSASSGEAQTLVVFAAASMTESLSKAGESFSSSLGPVEISYNFDSSGTLKTQIEEGADCDVFISAGQKQMNQLDITADPEVNTDGLDFVDPDTRFDILENKVTLCVPDDNPAGITGFDQLAERLAAHDVLLAMGNSDVPVGQYTQKILDFYGLDEEELAQAGCITYGTNVKEVTSQVREAAVDCGVIYATDAFSDGLTVVDEATADMCGRVVYPAAAMKAAPNHDLAVEYLEFLKGVEASACFEEVGFTPLV